MMISFSEKKAPRQPGRVLSAFAAAICLGVAPAAFGQFAPEDEVRLRRDEPLLFKAEVFRQGKAGETFKVISYDPAAGRVFVLATGSDGKPFALHCSDQALEPMPKDYWALLHEGVRTMQQGDMVGARAIFVRAATAGEPDKSAFGLAIHCEAMDRAVADLAAARTAGLQAAAEAARLLRNAQVTDRPSLIAGDDSNQVRAAEMRKQAAGIRTQAQQNIARAEEALQESINAADAFAAGLLASGSLSVGLPVSDAIANYSAKVLPAGRAQTVPREMNRAEINFRINTASDALAKARVAMDGGRLHGALALIRTGLQAEPGRGELKRLSLEVESRLNRVRTLLSLATSLKGQHRLDEALAEVVKAEAICSDDDDLRGLAKELRGSPSPP
jgi:tetratricopeptide (TPR) repeat protein